MADDDDDDVDADEDDIVRKAKCTTGQSNAATWETLSEKQKAPVRATANKSTRLIGHVFKGNGKQEHKDRSIMYFVFSWLGLWRYQLGQRFFAGYFVLIENQSPELFEG